MKRIKINFGKNDLKLLIKSLTYRLFGTITTIIIAYIFTGNIVISSSVGIFEFLSKIFLYYMYDKIWLVFEKWFCTSKLNDDIDLPSIIDSSNYRSNCYKFGRSNNTRCFWFTGLQCSGKTTIAKALKDHIENSVLLDGDAIRSTINYDLTMNRQSRMKNIDKISRLTNLLMDQGYNVIVSCVSKDKNLRRLIARKIIGEDKYNEIYCTCSSIDLKKRRKNLHKDTKILFNEYEESDYKVLKLDTSLMNVDQCIKRIKKELL